VYFDDDIHKYLYTIAAILVNIYEYLKWRISAAHPNVRLFITHGGLLSTQEALNRGVPVVGIPVFGDQSLNMAWAQSAGYGITLSLHNITKGSVSWAIKEVLENDRYLRLSDLNMWLNKMKLRYFIPTVHFKNSNYSIPSQNTKIFIILNYMFHSKRPSSGGTREKRL
jgi:hypothetical protein